MSDKDYQPDWDNIPAEFKYCYVHNDHKNIIFEQDSREYPPCYTTYIRPPELVEDAWYAVTDIHGNKRMGKYCANKMNLGGSYWVNTSELTIHQRIPDSMWECEDG